MSQTIRFSLYGCLAGMLYLGLFPGAMVNLAERATEGLQQPAAAAHATIPSRPEISRQ
jgi:hypothetical protein